ncbi:MULTISPECIES: non-homologous end-joining DNA ligase [Actinoalloteichus]|nr:MULTISPECIES: non-homologous end-joining DNA ligase [Actinoalloteichus]
MSEGSGAGRQAERLPVLRPMLATGGQPMPTGPDWAWEFKFDGVRAIAAGDRAGVRLTSRNGNDITATYPELTVLGEILGAQRAVLDGEIVAMDDKGRPSFALLQRRMHVQRPTARLTGEIPVACFVFDLLHLDGVSLLGESYLRRRELLDGLALDGRSARVRVPPSHRDVDPRRLLDIARDNGLEGTIGKRVASGYRPGVRSRDWLKFPLINTYEVVICGWQPGGGRRAGRIGSLMLGAHDSAGELRYVGHVGTGFTERMLAELLGMLQPIERPTSPFAGPVPREYSRAAHWVEPRLVGEVVYRTWSPDGRLRHSAWRGLRPDRDAREISLPAW